MSSRAPHFCQTLKYASQAYLALAHSSRQCCDDLRSPSRQTLHVGRIPMHWSQVPIGSSRFRVSQMKVPKLWEQEPCQILANTWRSIKLLRLSYWMKERITGISNSRLKFIYPHLTEQPKKGKSPKGGVACQCHSPRSQGRLSMKPI